MPDLDAHIDTISLWLPILLSAVFVFIASSIIHMALPIHCADYKKLGNEDAALKGLRDAGVAPGDYMFPAAKSMKDMGNPDYVAKLNLGPVGHMTILPNGPWSMGRSLVQWFLFSVVISIVAAYLGTLALPHGAAFGKVLRVTGTAAILGYAFSNVTNSIWKGVNWTTTFKFVVDGVVYGLVTGATFGWLWPKAL